MKLEVISTRSMDENVYIYYDESTMEGVVIDPGDDEDRIISLIDSIGVKVKAILLTHGHHDHMGVVPKIIEKYNCPVGCHIDEKDTLEDVDINLSSMRGRGIIEFSPDFVLNEGDVYKFGEKGELKVIHTPGHTMGGACYYAEKEKLIFTGDSVFRANVGRTDFPAFSKKKGQKEIYTPEEKLDMLTKNIKEKLFILPEDTLVFTGHGPESSIGFEKRNNPYCQ